MAALTPDNVLSWLQTRKSINLAGLATAAEISPVTLRAYVSGGRNMPAKTGEKLLSILREEFKELFESPSKLKPGEGVKMFVDAVENARANTRTGVE